MTIKLVILNIPINLTLVQCFIILIIPVLYSKLSKNQRSYAGALYLDKDAYMKIFEFSADLINSLREQIF